MKRAFIISVIFILTAFSANLNARIRVVDSGDNNPIAGATIIGKSGIIVGLTDKNGYIGVEEQELPATIRSIGYEANIATHVDETVKLAPAVYTLSDVIVDAESRPVKRVICFAREFSSGVTSNDTLQLYCEYMTESFVADDKVKGYKKSDVQLKIKNNKEYARQVSNNRDSVYIPGKYDDTIMLRWFEMIASLPINKINISEDLAGKEFTDTIDGKYGPQSIIKKKNGILTITTDELSNHKDRQWSPLFFKLFGMTVDVEECKLSVSYRAANQPVIDIYDLINMDYNIQVLWKGKIMKKIFNTSEAVGMNTYIELYPVEITNISVGEYKELRKDKEPLPFQYPEGYQPLSPRIDEMVKHLDAK